MTPVRTFLLLYRSKKNVCFFAMFVDFIAKTPEFIGDIILLFYYFHCYIPTLI